MSAHKFSWGFACGCNSATGVVCADHQNPPASVPQPLQGELELLARQLHNVIEQHKPVGCPGCFGTFLQASARLRELGVVPR